MSAVFSVLGVLGKTPCWFVVVWWFASSLRSWHTQVSKGPEAKTDGGRLALYCLRLLLLELLLLLLMRKLPWLGDRRRRSSFSGSWGSLFVAKSEHVDERLRFFLL